ncbi:MAG: extracellular solute-binding protein, partial [Chloroflexi bacterium]|nr:extracellular solute-binding protein [Chloroflexota bacterium]
MTSKQSGLLAGIAAALALVLAGCGADPTATPTSVPTATPPPQAAATPTPDEAALFQAEWDALIAAAQEEGELTMVFGGAAGRNFREIAEAFGERFGIEVTVATGGGTAGAQRIMAEQATGRYLVDLMFGGSGVAITTMAPAGALAPIGELFIHPEVTDLSLWYNGRHWYTDAEQKFVFAFAATARPEN